MRIWCAKNALLQRGRGSPEMQTEANRLHELNPAVRRCCCWCAWCRCSGRPDTQWVVFYKVPMPSRPAHMCICSACTQCGRAPFPEQPQLRQPVSWSGRCGLH